MALTLDRERLERIISAAADELSGDWVLLGGAAVALWLEPRRVTEDVDLVAIEGTAAERLALMDLALRLGLPIESVNSAADFFLRRIDGWRDEIELLRSGARGRIFRPTATLLVLLKMARLSENDLADCLAALEHTRAMGTRLDAVRLVREMDLLPATNDSALAKRRAELRAALG